MRSTTGWALLLLLVQGRRPVDRLATALLALDQVLRVVVGGPHRPTGGLGVLGDLLLHRSYGLAAVGPPGDAVALVELCHAGAVPTGPATTCRPPLRQQLFWRRASAARGSDGSAACDGHRRERAVDQAITSMVSYTSTVPPSAMTGQPPASSTAASRSPASRME